VNCTEFLSQLTDYFDGNVPVDLLAEIKDHLCSCHHCEVVVETTRKTISIYRDNQVYELEPSLRERLHAAIMKKCNCGPKSGS